ncbi:MAG: ABC transporter substrate-binding protein [Lachnospiraceae bacterium]|nr:ABC transporter substrate-binding protein [Lachnospiraceae bacterium]
MRKKLIALLSAVVFLLSGCSILPTSGTKQFVYNTTEKSSEGKVNEKKFLKKFESNGFKKTEEYQNIVAERFQIIDYQKYGRTLHLLVINGNENYLIYPDGFSTEEITKDFGDDLTLIEQGTKNIYLAATACGADFRAINAIGNIAFSSINAKDWYVQELRDSMNRGSIKFAGKYSAPDYELLTDSKASLAIESTMILHTPAVREKLIKLGIPVFTDYSSYESSAEARMEWVKVYGLITGNWNQAVRFFNEKYDTIRKVDDMEKTGKSVVYFSLDAENNAVVRTSTDYIPGMIRSAGGEYAFSGLTSKNKDSHSPTVSITFEEFYKTAKDADVLLVNTTIEGEMKSIADLESKNKLFSDFKAVQNGDIYETSADIYQSVDKSDEIITDMHRIFTGKEPEKYFTRLS